MSSKGSFLYLLLFIVCHFSIASVTAAGTEDEPTGTVTKLQRRASLVRRQDLPQDTLAGSSCSYSCPASFEFDDLVWMGAWVEEGQHNDEGRYACFYRSAKARDSKIKVCYFDAETGEGLSADPCPQKADSHGICDDKTRRSLTQLERIIRRRQRRNPNKKVVNRFRILNA